MLQGRRSSRASWANSAHWQGRKPRSSLLVAASLRPSDTVHFCEWSATGIKCGRSRGVMYLRAFFAASFLAGVAALCLPETELYSYVQDEAFTDEFRSSNRLNILSDNVHAVVAVDAPDPDAATLPVPVNSNEFTSGIRIIKVDDPNDFQIISTIAIPGEASDTIVRYSLYQDSYIYFGDFSGFLQVWSIEDLETPTLLSDSIFVGILTETAIDNVNGRLYMTRDAQDGNPNAFIMYDISQDPANPQFIGMRNNTDFRSTTAMTVSSSGTHVYIGTAEGTLVSVGVTTSFPDIFEEFTNDDLEENSNSNEPGPDDLDIYMDDILLVTTRNPKLVSFYDISNPNTFQLISKVEIDERPTSVVADPFRNGLLYTKNIWSYSIIDASDVNNPIEIETIFNMDQFDGVGDIQLLGTTILIASDGNFQMFDGEACSELFELIVVTECPNSDAASGQIISPLNGMPELADAQAISEYLQGNTIFGQDLWVQPNGKLGCVGLIADGNSDGVVDILDVNGFYQLLLNENSCPQGFSIGGCANFPSPPPVPCADVLRNGDVNQNSELDLNDLTRMAENFIGIGIPLTDCELRSADGVPDGQLTLADINGFSQLLVNPSVCPEGFTEEAATTPQGQACSLDP